VPLTASAAQASAGSARPPDDHRDRRRPGQALETCTTTWPCRLPFARAGRGILAPHRASRRVSQRCSNQAAEWLVTAQKSASKGQTEPPGPDCFRCLAGRTQERAASVPSRYVGVLKEVGRKAGLDLVALGTWISGANRAQKWSRRGDVDRIQKVRDPQRAGLWDTWLRRKATQVGCACDAGELG
jgi:hypothetical protein